MQVENWPLMEEAGHEGSAGGSDPYADGGASPGTAGPNGDNEGQGTERPLENQVAELTRKLGNAVEGLEQAQGTIKTLQDRPAQPAVPSEDLAILSKMKDVFNPNAPDADPVAALGPAPDIYTDGVEEYQKWQIQRNAIDIQQGVRTAIQTQKAADTREAGEAGYKTANSQAERDFKTTFKRNTGRDITPEELTALATFTNNNIAATGGVFANERGSQSRAFQEEDLWKGYRLVNMDEIISKAASNEQSSAAAALRAVSDPAIVAGSGPTDSVDFDQMTAMDQAVTLKTLTDGGGFQQAKGLIDTLRSRDPGKLRQVREILANAEEAAKDEGFGGMRTF